jgi:hypothetical protein
MNYKSNKIYEIKGKRILSQIRTKNSMRKIYAVKTYPTTENSHKRLMQIPRCYKGYDNIPSDRYEAGYWASSYTCASFRSLLRINSRWHIDLPYYCYAYKHTYRRLPFTLSLKLDCIAICGEIQYLSRKLKDRTHFHYSRAKWYLSPQRRYREYRERKADEKFWFSLGGG